MSIVHLLDDNTINKIAAGEVVERPASVVKELVENAIDAGASRIEVEIQSGGTSLIRVTDNGKGMSMEDAKLAMERHATSKINAVDDLLSIGTLGFRGEALPTIASVSRFTMRTRQEGSELGTLVTCSGGKQQDVRETGCSLGTTIQVEDLFFNTPARKKFLKTNQTEASKINDFIIKLALSHPEIMFRFINGGKAAVVTPGNGILKDVIASLYGKQAAASLLELSFYDGELLISGYITKPNMLKSSRAWQTFMVNGRIIQNRAMAKAIENAYRAMVPKSGFPMAVLSLEVPKNTVDVNVHPQKTELKFEDESRIFKAVYKSVVDALRPSVQQLGQMAAVVPNVERHYTMEPMQFIPASEPSTEMPKSPERNGQPYTPKTIYEAVNQSNGSAMSFHEAQEMLHSKPIMPADSSEIADVENVTVEGNRAVEALRYDGSIIPIGQVDLCYIIAQDKRGLYIVDQHAAHERILFDKFSSMADGIPSQQLLVHLVLEFDAREADLIENNRELFHSLGFTMEPSGEREFRLTEIPSDVPIGEAEDIIREILSDIQEQHRTTAKDIRQSCLATTACRAAIKAGEALNIRQMQIILEELAHTDFPYTCPHGRPTVLKFSSDELAKMFKRTGF